MALTVNYNLDNHGWAELHMCFGRERVSMTVSYLHDTFAELITAANLLLKGAPDAKVIAMDEPGEQLIHLHSNDALNLSIEVRWFKDWASWNMITEKEFEVVFQCRETILNFSTEVFNNATRILEKHGVEGYKEKWIENDFPIDEYKRLKSLLNK
jgi:hypothetical protein